MVSFNTLKCIPSGMVSFNTLKCIPSGMVSFNTLKCIPTNEKNNEGKKRKENLPAYYKK